MLSHRQHLIAMATGKEPADLLISNARIFDVFTGQVLEDSIAIANGIILGFGKREAKENYDAQGKFLLPGFIDTHIHIESTMLSPVRFAELVVQHGTTTVLADPHEIANVAGITGLRYFLDCAKSVPINLFLALPSCVPATSFEDAGAVLSAKDLAPLLKEEQVASIGEMMNYPGVLAGDEDCLNKILSGEEAGKVIDGHAPMLFGQDLDAYILSGVRNNHECSTVKEMEENLQRGIYVLVREGSAAKDLLHLLPSIRPENVHRCAFCCDDRHAEDLLNEGHIDHILRKAVAAGLDPKLAIRMATLNAAEAIGLKNRGGIAPGWIADLVLVDDLSSFTVREVWNRGRKAVHTAHIDVKPPVALLDTVHLAPLTEEQFDINITGRKVKTIGLLPATLLTELRYCEPSDPTVCRLAVIERHTAKPRLGLGFLQGYGVHGGAIGLSISHDSHNLVIAGDSSKAMLLAAQELERIHGGVVLTNEDCVIASLALPIAGLMSDEAPEKLAAQLNELIRLAHEKLGVRQEVEPFVSLSFMALPVIPHLKLTARGLFDVDAFTFTSL